MRELKKKKIIKSDFSCLEERTPALKSRQSKLREAKINKCGNVKVSTWDIRPYAEMHNPD